MLIDKPRCNFKNCRYCFDGNCYSADKYENCKLTDLHSEIAKLTVDLDNAKAEVSREIISEIDNRLHDMAMEYANRGHKEYFAVCEMVHHKVIRPVEKKYAEEKT